MKSIAPDFYAEKIEHITADFLKSLGADWVLVDIDNTLVPRNSKEVPEASLKWVKNLRKRGFRIVLVSNSVSARAKSIADRINAEGVLAPAVKPLIHKVRKFLLLNRIPVESSVFIGDQVFTDLLMGKRLGLKVILIKPISDSDLPHTRILRGIEKILIKRWLDGSMTTRLGDI